MSKPSDLPRQALRQRLAVIRRWMEYLAARPGERAALRRAVTPADVYGREAAHRLAAQLSAGGSVWEEAYYLAALLAGLRPTKARDEKVQEGSAEPAVAEKALIAALTEGAKPDEPESYTFKQRRFAQLLRADDLDVRLRLFRRALQLAGRAVDPVDLSYQFLTWDANDTKREFARRYFTSEPQEGHDEAAPAAAAESPTSPANDA